MRLLYPLLVLIVASQAFAVGRPGGKKGHKRGAEHISRGLEKVEQLNNTASQVLGQKVQVEMARRLTEQEAQVITQKIESLKEALQKQEAEMTRDSVKKNEVASLLNQMTPAMKARDGYKKFLESAGKDKASEQAAKDLIDLIDNMFTIIKSKVSETAESPVSTGQISRVIDALGKTPTGRLSKADVINVEKTVTSILGREFTARNAAKCE